MEHRKKPYEPVAFWTEEGKVYHDRFNRTQAFIEQEEALIQAIILRYPVEDMWTFLEAGCGFGRIPDLLFETYGPQNLYYLGFDLSEDQLRHARQRVPMSHSTFLQSTIDEFDLTDQFDLVLAIEVLMHVKPEDLERTVDKLRSSGPLITVDWTEPVEGPIDNHNFIHDYEALGLKPIRKVGLQTIFSSEG